jgi:hypothetical protein
VIRARPGFVATPASAAKNPGTAASIAEDVVLRSRPNALCKTPGPAPKRSLFRVEMFSVKSCRSCKRAFQEGRIKPVIIGGGPIQIPLPGGQGGPVQMPGGQGETMPSGPQAPGGDILGQILRDLLGGAGGPARAPNAPDTTVTKPPLFSRLTPPRMRIAGRPATASRTIVPLETPPITRSVNNCQRLPIARTHGRLRFGSIGPFYPKCILRRLFPSFWPANGTARHSGHVLRQ